ncbi:dihydrofolate reductase family protein [Oerskovia sp. M15]
MTALKETPGLAKVLVAGSISVVRQLLAAGLVDELSLLVHPVAARSGSGSSTRATRSTPAAAALRGVSHGRGASGLRARGAAGERRVRRGQGARAGRLRGLIRAAGPPSARLWPI